MKKKGWGTFVPRECYLQRAIAVSSAATLPISLAAAFISASFSLGLNPFFFFPIGVPSFPLLMVLLYHTACSMSTLLKTFLLFLQFQSTLPIRGETATKAPTNSATAGIYSPALSLKMRKSSRKGLTYMFIYDILCLLKGGERNGTQTKAPRTGHEQDGADRSCFTSGHCLR